MATHMKHPIPKMRIEKMDFSVIWMWYIHVCYRIKFILITIWNMALVE